MHATISKRQMVRFIKMRNASLFNTNLQFQIDAETCGFRVNDLGEVKVVTGEHGIKIYEWTTPYGVLREQYGKLTLETKERSAA